MKTKLVSIFASAAGLMLAAAQPAFGIPLPTGITVGFTVTPSNLNVAGCAPTISGKLGNKSITTTTFAHTYNLLTLAPAGHCPGNYAEEELSLNFSVTGVAATTGDPTETGWYTARYTLPTLPCALSDPASTHGQSDCINWDPAHSLIEFDLGGADAGYTLDITLHDAIDWNIVPTVTYQIVDTPLRHETPEPSSLPLTTLALGALLLLARRRSDPTR